ncbi:galactose-3-O-sulfotransferase 2-like [Physella acuta]|uniref:galactose-3-O-sulfotransferase 2-like n=1 Tax=Physella acuta TaxID=109671 RepID=UPI0027DD5741|nr:galactose-3-O-sulfotransferase 2-like [Physella acuta]
MAKCFPRLYCWVRLAMRRPRLFYTLVLVVIVVYFVFIAYMACSKAPFLDSSRMLAPYILDFNGQCIYEFDYLNYKNISHRVRSTCKEKTNFVFIKGMKCATSTLLGVFYRFGYLRNLSFVSPLDNKMYLNWPFPMTRLDFRPSSRGYNILTDHAIFTETVMDAIMPKDTVYISIIREPLAQLKSIFQYFKVAKIAGVPEDSSNPIAEYFSHLELYEKSYTSHSAKYRWCVPDGFSMTKNLMAYCHGMPLGFPAGTKDISQDEAAIDQFIQHLDQKFSLIMIVEYFYESLILLRRLMCWQFKDIIFISANIANYDFNPKQENETVQAIHRNWSHIDYKLYNYFNKTLWKHIGTQSSEFFLEVEDFKLVESQVQTYCQQVYTLGKNIMLPASMSQFKIAPSNWTDQFSVYPSDCWMLGPNPYELLHQVQKEHDAREVTLLAEFKKIPDNRTADMKGTC